MPKTIEFVLARAQATADAQTSFQAQWLWDEKSVADWAAGIKALRAQQEVVSTKETAMLAKRGVYQGTLDEMHARTVQAVAMMKVRYKRQPARLAVVQNLTARGDSQDDILREALSLCSKWKELEPAWNPTQTNTLAALTALRTQALEPQRPDYENARTAWRAEAETMNTLAAHLEDDCVRWYGSAAKVFLAGTPEGDLLRGTVPTTTANHPHAAPPPPPPPPAPAK